MSVGLSEPKKLLVVDGIRLATTSAGFYQQERNDILVIEIVADATAAAVFTRNRFCAAPVIIARSHLNSVNPRYILVNAGNANAGTGQQGIDDALASCQIMAGHGNCSDKEVLPFSTGVIGQRLPVDNISAVLPECLDELSTDGWHDAARAIMTTDTIAKGISRRMNINGSEITITAIAKGSGMIKPDMATMLAFIATNARIERQLLKKLLGESTECSFNRITVDGDTSTNDACLLIATGKSEVRITEDDIQACNTFRKSLDEVCQHLAQAIVRDGEGATKFVTVQIERGKSKEECLQVAYNIAHSLLVKTALFASDPNWGRILAAVGRSGIDDLDISTVEIYLDNVCIVIHGGMADTYTEEQGQAVMDKQEILIRVVLNRGSARECVWTTDLSYEYVKINAEYRS